MNQEDRKQENISQENKEQETLKDNIWDIMFKTILQEMPYMALPLMNEAFREDNMLLEMIKNVEECIFNDYPAIKKEVKPMVANILNLETIKMRDEAERQKKEAVKQATEQTAKIAARQASLSSIETIKKFGISLTDEQIQEILNNAVEQQES